MTNELIKAFWEGVKAPYILVAELCTVVVAVLIAFAQGRGIKVVPTTPDVQKEEPLPHSH